MARKYRHLLAVCLAKGQNDIQRTFMGFCLNSHKICSQLYPSQTDLKICVIFTIHTKRKVVEKSSNVLSTRQLYGCHSESCQSRQHWQPKCWQTPGPHSDILGVVRSCHADNLVPSRGCQNRHRKIDNLKVHIVVNMTLFWTPFDNLWFCVLAATCPYDRMCLCHMGKNLTRDIFLRSTSLNQISDSNPYPGVKFWPWKFQWDLTL